jgi:hypothetical protein
VARLAQLVALIEQAYRQLEEMVALPLESEAPESWHEVLWQQPERFRDYINAAPRAAHYLWSIESIYFPRCLANSGCRASASMCS